NLSSLLSKINKIELIKSLLLNHDAIECDSKQWKRTSRAILALHSDKEDVYNVISKEISKRNSGSISTRIAIEIALCDASNESGLKPTKLELSKILTACQSMFILGGWSDAIHYDALEP